MLTENITHSFVTISGLFSFIIFLLLSNYSNRYKFFLDKDFKKPQAFHNVSTPRVGGLASIISFLVVSTTFYYIFETKILEYIVISTLLFILGFIDDIKILIKPSLRLIIMTSIMLFSLIYFNIEIPDTGFWFLNRWLDNSVFNYCFLLLCFLFIINGSNLIDGFNGLLAIHLILINLIIFIFSYMYNDLNFSLFIICQLIILFCFLLFNFPSAKIFMGDGGAYFFGGVTALNCIYTSKNIPNISPLFFTILLFYLFFEVFFSFVRKLKEKKSPIKPDNEHLHMLFFNFLNKNKKFKNANAITGITINSVYLALIVPAFLYNDNTLFCRYWFLFLILIYLIFYYFLKKNHKQKL